MKSRASLSIAKVATPYSTTALTGCLELRADNTGFYYVDESGAVIRIGNAQSVATTTANGLMSKEDKIRLDGLVAAAEDGAVTSVNAQTGVVVLTATDVDAVPVPSTSKVNNHVVVFDGTTGAIKDGGYTIGSNVPVDAVFTDTTYTAFTGATGAVAGTLSRSQLPYATSTAVGAASFAALDFTVGTTGNVTWNGFTAYGDPDHTAGITAKGLSIDNGTVDVRNNIMYVTGLATAGHTHEVTFTGGITGTATLGNTATTIATVWSGFTGIVGTTNTPGINAIKAGDNVSFSYDGSTLLISSTGTGGGGGLSTVTVDATLSGTGSAENPLSINAVKAADITSVLADASDTRTVTEKYVVYQMKRNPVMYLGNLTSLPTGSFIQSYAPYADGNFTKAAGTVTTIKDATYTALQIQTTGNSVIHQLRFTNSGIGFAYRTVNIDNTATAWKTIVSADNKIVADNVTEVTPFDVVTLSGWTLNTGYYYLLVGEGHQSVVVFDADGEQVIFDTVYLTSTASTYLRVPSTFSSSIITSGWTGYATKLD